MSDGETIIKKNDNCAESSVLESEQKIADFINFMITAVFQETPTILGILYWKQSGTQKSNSTWILRRGFFLGGAITGSSFFVITGCGGSSMFVAAGIVVVSAGGGAVCRRAGWLVCLLSAARGWRDHLREGP